MTYTVLGAGALGSIIGGSLIQAGEEVTFLVRGERAAHLQSQGLSVTGLVDFTIPCQIETDPRKIKGSDVLIVTVKTYQNMDAIRPLKHAQFGSVFSVQNGILKNRQLMDVFGQDAVLGAIGVLSGELLADGLVRFTMNRIIELGELPNGISKRTEAIVTSLNNAGINASASDAIESSEWSKFIGWTGWMAPSVITRLETYKFLLDADAARIAARLMRETAALANALGISVYPMPPMSTHEVLQGTEDEAVAAINQVGKTFRESAPKHRMSSLQDIDRGQHLEIEETLGYALREAQRLGVPMPTVDTCYRLLSCVDRSLDG